MFCRNCASELSEKAEVCMSCGLRPLSESKYCQECGAETSEKQEICVKCGCRVHKAAATGFNIDSNEIIYPSNPPKSPATATLISCFVPGVGQVYLGQTAKGLVCLAATFALSTFTAGIGYFPIWIAMMVDANLIGKKLERGQSVRQWEFF
ncbi:zinc ribbon domain-containing protein [Proteinivorax hydrogeniformans]|uniref:Zinc ribbon domain-containing protein n=1 Tax=Proteinivorax hydrogeniformans TaxID=1826727 RepID=A0AAU8HU80_9FIRM